MKLKIINLDAEQLYQTYCDGTGDRPNDDDRSVFYAIADEFRALEGKEISVYEIVHTIYKNTGIDYCIEVEDWNVLTLSNFSEHYHCAAGLRLEIGTEYTTLSQYEVD